MSPDIYQALKLPDDPASTRQVAAFTLQSMKGIWQGQARRTLTDLGYDDRRIALADAAVLTRLEEHAQTVAESISSTVNAMLERRLDAMPDTVTLAEAKAELQPFWDSVAAYNRDVLIPYTSATARQDAVRSISTSHLIPARSTLAAFLRPKTRVWHEVIQR